MMDEYYSSIASDSDGDANYFCFDLGPNDGNLNPRIISLDPSYNDFNDRCTCSIGRGMLFDRIICFCCLFELFYDSMVIGWLAHGPCAFLHFL